MTGKVSCRVTLFVKCSGAPRTGDKLLAACGFREGRAGSMGVGGRRVGAGMCVWVRVSICAFWFECECCIHVFQSLQWGQIENT